MSHTDIGAGPSFLIWADVLRYAFGFEVMFVVKFQVGFVGWLFLREVCEVYDSGVLVKSMLGSQLSNQTFTTSVWTPVLAMGGKGALWPREVGKS